MGKCSHRGKGTWAGSIVGHCRLVIAKVANVCKPRAREVIYVIREAEMWSKSNTKITDRAQRCGMRRWEITS